MAGVCGCICEAENEEAMPVNRGHSQMDCIFIASTISLCITVDILQYSMPLAFLPSVLEDKGHETFEIATAIGVYYWTGFLGCTCITSYQIYQLITGSGHETVTSLISARRWVVYLIIGLGFGTVTLAFQAMSPHIMMHTSCRFIQGFAGAFIFFYAFLLNVELFEGGQQVFAMTAASIALNIAEVLGSSLGAVLYHHFGQRTVFVFLAVASMLNQILLCVVTVRLTAAERMPRPRSPDASPPRTPYHQQTGWRKFKSMLTGRRQVLAVLLIVMSAVVKGSVEEILPFHADHRWHYDPMMIGKLFLVIALAYIVSAALVGRLWEFLHNFRIIFSAFWLFALGVSAYGVMIVASLDLEPDKAQTTLFAALAFYGVCLGLTHTPSALLLADAIEHEEGKAKDAINGIWNTMWEAGGSLGFLLGGLLAHGYKHQVELMVAYAVCCFVTAAAMLVIHYWPRRWRQKNKDIGESQPLADETADSAGDTGYGATMEPFKPSRADDGEKHSPNNTSVPAG